MDHKLVAHCILLLSMLRTIEAQTAIESDSLPDNALRVPRVSGRIVKVYSGTRPDPIHCSGEGFQGDPKNCAIFYRCMKSGNGKFTVFRFQCGPGTVYDPDREVCNHPRSTRRSECGGLVEPSSTDQNLINEIEDVQPEIPSPIVTKQPVYTISTTASHKPVMFTRRSTQESTVSPLSMSTKPSTKNEFIKITTHPYGTSTLVQMYDTTNIRTEYPGVVFTKSPKPDLLDSTSQPTKTYNLNQQPSPSIDDICFSDGFMGDSKNCRKFYRCVSDQRGGYVKYEFSCSESTMWDDDIQSCNHPWAVKRSRCGRSNINNDNVASSVFKSTTETLPQPQLKPTPQPNQTLNNEINFISQQQAQISYGSEVSPTQTQITYRPITENQTQVNKGSAIIEAQTQTSYGEISTKVTSTIKYDIERVDSTEHSIKHDYNNKCTESGFMGDDNDCKKFYRCIDNGRGYTRYEFSCGEGTVWDPKIEACNHAWAVKECGGKVSTEVVAQTTEPSYTTSSQNYNPTVSTQNYITSSSTAAVAINEDSDNDNGYGNQIQQTTPFEESTAKPSKQDNSDCKSSGFVGDVNDCKKFYRCVDNGKGSFTKYEFQCGDGTVWDPDIEACNHAWAVKACGGKVSTEVVVQTTEPSYSTSTQYYNQTASTQNYIPSSSIAAVAINEDSDNDSGYGNQIQQTTPFEESTAKPSKHDNSDCNSSGFFGDVNYCKKFYRCVDNGKGSFTKYEFECGDGTVWDPDIEACNHAWAVKNCGGIGANNDKVNTTTNSVIIDSTSEIISTVSTPVSTQNPHQDDENETGYNGSHEDDIPYITTSTTQKPQNQGATDNNCKSSGFMGDKNDCKKFYRCVDNGDGSYVRYEFTCGEGTVWDPKIDACNHGWAVEKCGSGGSGSVHNETSSETSSTGYEEIDSGYPTQSDKNTDRPTQSSTTVKSTTSETNVENNNCKESGFMGDNNDCKKFYRCVDNGDGSYVRYEFSCGEGTVWDPKIEACNHAWAVEKCGSVSETVDTSVITSTENPIWSDDEINNGYPSQNDEELDEIIQNTTKIPMIETTTELNTNGICKHNGFIGDKGDCRKFYRCVDDGKGNFIKYEFTCGEGTVWDQNIESCNHPEYVKDCEKNINQSTPIYSESTTQSTPISISESDSNGYYPQSTEGSSTSTIKGPQESTNNNICTMEGFFSDQNDCKKFYRCVDNNSGGFIKYEFVCGEGTVWVQDIQACDHATSDQPCGGNTNEISKEPIHENDEIYTESTTKISTTFSTQVSSTQVSPIQETEKPQSSSSVCKSEGFFGDPNDCMKFYRCVDNGNESFTKYDFICGEGTFWDQDIHACNHITENKKCRQSQTTTISHASESNMEHSTTAITMEQQSSTEKTPPSSPSDNCSSGGFFANSNDCSKFIRCVSNGKGGYIKYDFSCGEGTIWVQDIQACDYDDGITTCNKQNGSVKPQSTEQYQSTTEASYLTSSTLSSVSQVPEKQDDEYPENEPISGEQCSSEGFYADNNDCKKFYRCVDDGHGGYTKYNFDCGEGTAWDANIQGCNHISEVKGCQASTQEGTPTQSVMQDEQESQVTEGTSTTKKATSSTESSTTESNNKCEKEGYFGNTEDCKQFYRCVDDGNGGLTKYEFTCGEGTIWDQDITTCNHPEDVTRPSCKQKQTDSTSASPPNSTGTLTSTTETTQSSTSTTESNQNSNNCNQEQSSNKPINNNVTCDKAGYYGYPNDCKKFYRCVDWDGNGQRFSVYHFECGEGTIWDPALDTCNHEESVYPPRDCSGTQSQNENIAENTTTTSQENTTTEKLTTQQPSSTTEQSAQQTNPGEQATTQQTTVSEQTTTQQSFTSEETTTQQATTSEQTTTQLATTSEQTTTQQATSSEQTTTQKSTTTKQTTQQSTTSEQTTQQTTSESTTTEKTTTSEPTTTQLSTTSEETTTQLSTTSEQITQQTTSREPTTTQQSTTTEETTTQQSTSNNPATTVQSSTNGQATTQQPTTSEISTTQQSETTEQTTSQPPATTEQTTTQQSTTNQETTTTEQSTTTSNEQTSTEQTTTSVSTTNGNTTEEMTTSESSTTTNEQTSEASTTENTVTEQTSSTTEQSSDGTTTTEGEQETSTEDGSSNKKCPDTEDDQYLYVCPTSFRRHPKYCNLFYQCTEDNDNHDAKIAVFTCPNNTIYDESKTQCVEEEKASKKCDGEIAQRRRFKRLDANYKEPIVVGSEKQACPSVGYLPFEKKAECSPAFLKCKMSKSGALRGFVYKCPEGYIYWSISKRCELIANVSDCKRSNNNWDKRWEIPTEKTNIDAYKYKLMSPNSKS